MDPHAFRPAEGRNSRPLWLPQPQCRGLWNFGLLPIRPYATLFHPRRVGLPILESRQVALDRSSLRRLTTSEVHQFPEEVYCVRLPRKQRSSSQTSRASNEDSAWRVEAANRCHCESEHRSASCGASYVV